MPEPVPSRSDLPEEDPNFYSQIYTGITRRIRAQIADYPEQRVDILAHLATFIQDLSIYLDGGFAGTQECYSRADDRVSSTNPDDTVRMFDDFIDLEDWETVATPSAEVRTLAAEAQSPDRRPLDPAFHSSHGPQPGPYDDLELFGPTDEDATVSLSMDPRHLSHISPLQPAERSVGLPDSEDEARDTLSLAVATMVRRTRPHSGEGKPYAPEKREALRVAKGVHPGAKGKPKKALGSNKFRAQLLSCYLDKGLVLTTDNTPVAYRLLAGIASGFAFRQLQSTLKAFRQRDLVLPPLLSSSTAQVFQGIMHSDRSSVISSFLRRFFLYQLSQRRDSLSQKIHERRNLRSSIKGACSDKGSTAAIALDELVAEMKSEEIDRTTVKNWLQSASRWVSASEKYSIGVLALIPMGGPYKISNSCVENLDSDSFRQVLDLLEKHRGLFIREASARLTSNLFPILEGNGATLHLENATAEIFSEEPVDSPSFLHLCQIA